MRRIQALGLFAALAVWLHSAFGADDEKKSQLPEAAKKNVDFTRDVKPLFVKHCISCHGAKKSEGGLRLDRRKNALAGGDSGVSIIAGKSAKSRLISLVAGIDPDNVMPPEGKRLSREEVAVLRAWVDQGARWPKDSDRDNAASSHWSFRPVVRPAIPSVTNSAWTNNAVDAFVLARLDKRNISPSAEASRNTLIRRLSLDLLGLPPTPAEVDRFVDDSTAGAYSRLVERLLASPRFGERWGRHWLDKARYADSDGYEKDRPRPNAWRWRDWVINAINRDLRFDQFTVEQLAGDLLPDATDMQRLATAFHRQTLTNTEGGTDQEQFRVEACFDRLETTGTVWLGLTIGCARCHSHKYDPISQREYYQLFAFMNNGDELNGFDVPRSQTEYAKFVLDKARHDEQLAKLQMALKVEKGKLGPELTKWENEMWRELSSKPTNSVKFHDPEVISVSSQNGVSFRRLDDGSYLAHGKNPDKDTYTIIVATDIKQISGFQLDTLADKSLPAKGPGRVKHGNFVLNEFEIYASDDQSFKKASKIELLTSRTDHAQKGFPVAKAVDSDPKTGWAVGRKYGEDHFAIFTTKIPLATSKKTFLKFVLKQEHGTQHTIGRFRIRLRTGREPGESLPDNIRPILLANRDKRSAEQKKSLLDYYASIHPIAKELIARVASHQKAAPKPPLMKVRVVVQRTKDPRTTFTLRRGDFLQPVKDARVKPAGLSILRPLESRHEKIPADRLDLAEWLVDPENSLTPRVVMNQMWSQLFGEGLVRTINDFGVRGEKPSHPQLLDWLASEFVRRDWSRKDMIRLIVNSATYRQSSAHRPQLAEIDPQNYLLSRQNRVRVEAEIIRDVTLAVAGVLSDKIGGPSVFPPMPPDVAALSYANNFKWNTSQGEDAFRRGMYTFFKRTAPHPNLNTFDCPDSNTTCVERRSSNTPLQALTTLNNQVFVDASRALARRVLSSKFSNDSDRLVFAYRLCVAREPSTDEQSRLAKFLAVGTKWFAGHTEDAEKLVGKPQAADITISENAVWVMTARIMLNLDEFITRE